MKILITFLLLSTFLFSQDRGTLLKSNENNKSNTIKTLTIIEKSISNNCDSIIKYKSDSIRMKYFKQKIENEIKVYDLIFDRKKIDSMYYRKKLNKICKK